MEPDSRRDALIAAARSVQEMAYCPYSNYAVGAAVMAVNGEIFTGTNVENASYGLTVCAERNAIFAAVGAGAMDFVAIAVVTPGEQPARPCGACRQVIAEFSQAENPIVVYSAGSGDEVVVETIEELLPGRFTLL
jgi:cytidine deaminase